MSKKVSKSMIGGFVIGAVALAFAAVLIFGSGKFLSARNEYVMFFEGSVKGLSQGAPVLFRGVKIGSVTNLKLLANPETVAMTIPVFVEVEPARFELVGQEGLKKQDIRENLKKLIEKGLRAQLEMQSFVTGQLVVALDFHPGTPINLKGEHLSLPEVPTIPSSMQAIAQSIEELPIHELVSKAASALDGLTKTVNSPEVGETIRNANLALGDLQELLQNLNGRVASVDKKLAATLDEATATLVQVRNTFNGLNHTTGPDSTMISRLGGTLDELSDAARSIRIFADYLEAHPEALVRGKSGYGGR